MAPHKVSTSKKTDSASSSKSHKGAGKSHSSAHSGHSAGSHKEHKEKESHKTSKKGATPVQKPKKGAPAPAHAPAHTKASSHAPAKGAGSHPASHAAKTSHHKAEAHKSEEKELPAKPAPLLKKERAPRKAPLTGMDAINAARAALVNAGETVCREVACEGLGTTGGYCRMHYIKNWKKIKRKDAILKEGKLNQYIEELVAKYPEKYIEAIRQDLASDKDFARVIHDLDLDESVDDFEAEGDGDNFIDSIRRDFEDDGDAF